VGTNYYLKVDICPYCTRPKKQLHIGKSSFGWCFALHVGSELGIEDLDDWQKLWNKQGNVIVDEYGEQILPSSMLQIITDRRFEPRETFDWELNHAIPGPNGCIRRELRYSCVKHGAGTWDCLNGEFS
jgi:hypothetical protein